MQTTINTIEAGTAIKTGKTGTKPTVQKVVWSGTAEVLLYECHRVPAALVETNRGDMAVVQLYGQPAAPKGATYSPERLQWWDARVTTCREWEDADANLVSGEIAERVDAALATADDSHEQAYRKLNDRCYRGAYLVVDPD